MSRTRRRKRPQFRLAQAAAYERAAALYGTEALMTVPGQSPWGDGFYEGWVDGTKEYRDATIKEQA